MSKITPLPIPDREHELIADDWADTERTPMLGKRRSVARFSNESLRRALGFPGSNVEPAIDEPPPASRPRDYDLSPHLGRVLFSRVGVFLFGYCLVGSALVLFGLFQLYFLQLTGVTVADLDRFTGLARSNGLLFVLAGVICLSVSGIAVWLLARKEYQLQRLRHWHKIRSPKLAALSPEELDHLVGRGHSAQVLLPALRSLQSFFNEPRVFRDQDGGWGRTRDQLLGIHRELLRISRDRRLGEGDELAARKAELRLEKMFSALYADTKLP